MGYKLDMLFDKRVMTGIKVSMRAKSIDGSTIFWREDEITKDQKLIDTSYSSLDNIEKEIIKNNSKVFNRVADTWLSECRKNGRKTLSQGVVVKGKHVVKVIWDIKICYHKPTKEEWLKLKEKEKKNNGKSK